MLYSNVERKKNSAQPAQIIEKQTRNKFPAFRGVDWMVTGVGVIVNRYKGGVTEHELFSHSAKISFSW